MEKPFKIRFQLPLERSTHIITLEAIAQLHHSSPYYIVKAFNYPDHSSGNHLSLLPEQKIRQIKEGALTRWVHTDSDKETQLSIAIGEAIEAALANHDLSA
jgi:hypothetical protein